MRRIHPTADPAVNAQMLSLVNPYGKEHSRGKELQAHVSSSWVDELWQEREEEDRCLRVQNVDEDSLRIHQAQWQRMYVLHFVIRGGALTEFLDS